MALMIISPNYIIEDIKTTSRAIFKDSNFDPFLMGKMEFAYLLEMLAFAFEMAEC